MCGRFVSTQGGQQLAAQFGALPLPGTDLAPNWNVAPAQQIFAVRQEGSLRLLDTMRWGFVPRWAKSLDGGPAPINARSETVGNKAMFKEAIRKRRCLIPADGFYEWQKRDSGSKQPYFIKQSNDGVMAMAGIWGAWGDEEIRTCAILTTEPNEVVAPIHNRMPVLIATCDWTEWLDPKNQNLEELTDLMQPSSLDLIAHPVSTRVNNPKANDEALIEELGSEG